MIKLHANIDRDKFKKLLHCLRDALCFKITCWFSYTLTMLHSDSFLAGSPLATATTYLWNIVLVLLCLVLSYILMYFVSWLFVLAFNCIIILLHYWFESWDILKYLYRQLISIFKWIYFFVFEHPYLLCVIVVLLFVCWLLKVMYSWCVRPYLVYRERHEERNRRRVMADSIIHLGEQLDEISERLSRIERHLGVQGHQ